MKDRCFNGVCFEFDAARLEALSEKFRDSSNSWGILVNDESSTLEILSVAGDDLAKVKCNADEMKDILNNTFNYIGPMNYRNSFQKKIWGESLPGPLGAKDGSGFICDEAFLSSPQFCALSLRRQQESCRRGGLFSASIAAGIKMLCEKGPNEARLIGSTLRKVVITVDPLSSQSCGFSWNRRKLIFTHKFIQEDNGTKVLEFTINMDELYSGDIDKKDVLALLENELDIAATNAQMGAVESFAEASREIRAASGGNRKMQITMDWSFLNKTSIFNKRPTNYKTRAYDKIYGVVLSLLVHDSKSSLLKLMQRDQDVRSYVAEVVSGFHISIDVNNEISTLLHYDDNMNDGSAQYTQATIDDSTGLCSFSYNLNRWDAVGGLGRAGTALGPLFRYQYLRRKLQMNVESACNELGLNVELDWESFSQSDKFLTKAAQNSSACHDIMHMLAGTTKGNVLTSLVTAFKDVIYAHPVSNAALREQVDNVKIIVHCSEVVRKKRQMGVAHEEPVEPHVCAPAKCITLKAESRTLLVEFNLDTIDSSAGKSCPFAEWATEIEWRLGCTLQKSRAIEEMNLAVVTSQIEEKKPGTTCGFSVDWELLFAHRGFTQVAARRGNPRWCLSVIHKVVHKLIKGQLYPAVLGKVLADPVGVAAFAIAEHRACVVKYNPADTLVPDYDGRDDGEADENVFSEEKVSAPTSFGGAELSVKQALTKDPKIRQIFDSLDADNSNSLDKHEVRAMAKMMGLPSSFREHLDQAFAQMDVDGSGVIEFEEFEAWWVKTNPGCEWVANLVDIHISADSNLTAAIEMESNKWGYRIEHILDLLEPKCRHEFGNAHICKARTIVEARLERKFPIAIDSTSFLNHPMFTKLTPWKQYEVLTVLLRDLPDFVVVDAQEGLMAMAKHDCGKNRLNEEKRGIVGGIKVLVESQDAQLFFENAAKEKLERERIQALGPDRRQHRIEDYRNMPSTGTSLQVDDADNTLTVIINLGVLCITDLTQTEKSEDIPGYRGYSIKESRKHFVEDRANPIKDIKDWRARVFQLFDMVVTLARFECEEETTAISQALANAFGGKMPVEIDWEGFVKTEQFLALAADDQANVTTVAATTMLDMCLSGEHAFATTGVGLCAFPQTVAFMLSRFSSIVFQIHAASELVESPSILPFSGSESVLRVHINLSAIIEVAREKSKANVHFKPLRSRVESAMAPDMRVVRQVAVAKEGDFVIAQEVEKLSPLIENVCMDWSFLDRPTLASDTEYVTQAKACTRQTISLLTGKDASFKNASLLTLVERTPELKAALEQRVKQITIQVSDTNTVTTTHGAPDARVFVERLDAVFEASTNTLRLTFNLETVSTALGAGRNVLLCLCPDIAEDHIKKHLAMVNTVSKWNKTIQENISAMQAKQRAKAEPLEAKQQALSSDKSSRLEPLRRALADKKAPVEKRIREIDSESRSLRERLKKEWLQSWKNNFPSCVGRKCPRGCKSSTSWFICTTCSHAWCYHPKCGHTGGNCPNCRYGHGAKANANPSPPNGAIDKDLKAGEKSFKEEIAQLKAGLDNDLARLQEEIRSVEQSFDQKIAEVGQKLRTLVSDTATMQQDMKDKGKTAGQKELNGMLLPGGHAYVSMSG